MAKFTEAEEKIIQAQVDKYKEEQRKREIEYEIQCRINAENNKNDTL